MTDATTSILFIDGNDKDRQCYAERLKVSSSDYQIFQTATGQSGLNLYKSRPIDCVILELDLPDISGFEVLVQLVPIVRHPEVAVIVLTVLTHVRLLELAVNNGALVTLRKSSTSGDDLHKTILQAVATIAKDRKKARFSANPLSELD